MLAVRQGADVINISEAACLPPARAAVAAPRCRRRCGTRRSATSSWSRPPATPGPAGARGGGSRPGVLPGWYDEDVLTVGAVGPDDAPAPFTVPGPWVDVAAPGTALRSLAVGGGTSPAEGVDGTSFAARGWPGSRRWSGERYPGPDRAAGRRPDPRHRTPPGRRARRRGRATGCVDPVAALTAVPVVLVPARRRRRTGPAPTADLRRHGPASRAATRAPGRRRSRTCWHGRDARSSPGRPRWPLRRRPGPG